MGKAAILLVMTSGLMLASASISREESEYNSNLTDADYQEQVLSREMAESALNVLIGKIKRDYQQKTEQNSLLDLGLVSIISSIDISNVDKVYRDRGYDISATPNPDGTLAVYSKGNVGVNQYEINGVIDLRYGRVLDAVTVDGTLDDFYMRGTPNISGLDKNADGTDGDGIDVHGLLTTSSNLLSDIFDTINPEKIIGVDGEGDAVNDQPIPDLAAMAAQILAYGGPNRIEYDSPEKFEGGTLGSVDDPVVVIAKDGFTLGGNAKGFGVLLVEDGDVMIRGDASWEGLVFCVGSDQKVEMRGTPHIIGALAILSDEGLDLQFDKRGTSLIQYSSQALRRLGHIIDFLSESNALDFTVTRLSEGASRENGLTSVQRGY